MSYNYVLSKRETNHCGHNRYSTLTPTFTMIRRSEANYPSVLREYLGSGAPASLSMLGDPVILKYKAIALFCSVRCPGSLILQTFDLVRELRDAGVALIGGFQSPMEKECLSLLLSGKRPVIWCQAKRLPNKQRPKIYAGPLAAGRLLIISPFDDLRRATEKSALIRNEFVAALADTIFVSYANPGGMLEKLCRKVLEWNKALFTFESTYNAGLIAMGARPCGDFVSSIELSP